MINIHRNLALAAVAICLMAPITQAQELTQGGNATFRELDALKTQNALLSEALKNAELKAKILETKKPKAEAKNEKESTRAVTNPAELMSAQVQMVSGTGRDLTALISLANGRQINARVGSSIQGLGTVQSIRLDEVLMAGQKGQVNSLPFASDTPGALPVTNLAPSGMGGVGSLGNIPMPPFPPSMMSNKAK